jgi:hypothetical protein
VKPTSRRSESSVHPKPIVQDLETLQAGMLVQMDASFHPWLEERSEPFVLLVAIDDATGEIFLVIKRMIEQKGIPMSIYSDRHTIFRSPKEATMSIEQGLADGTPPLSNSSEYYRNWGLLPTSRPLRHKSKDESSVFLGPYRIALGGRITASQY